MVILNGVSGDGTTYQYPLQQGLLRCTAQLLSLRPSVIIFSSPAGRREEMGLPVAVAADVQPVHLL